MPGPEHENGVILDLADEEEWVLHAALLDHLDRQADELEKNPPAGDVVTQLETDDELVLDDPELGMIQNVLSEYLAGAPLRDRAICRDVLSQVREEL